MNAGRTVLAALTLAFAAGGCDRAPAGTGGGSDAASPTAAPTPSGAAPAPTAAPTEPTRWAGAYQSKAGTMYVPDGGEWAKTTWRGDESTEGLGEGKLTLTVDPGNGAAEGAIEGPLGPAVVYGRVTGAQLTATIARKDIGDRGFVGTLDGKIGADAIEGIVRVSSAEANVIREAPFQLKKGSE